MVGMQLIALVLVSGVTSLFNADDTEPGDFPFMARLSSSWRPQGHWCGGSLISPRTVLTAAHCVAYNSYWRTDPADLVVTVGDYARNVTEKTERRMKVSRIIVHEEYRRGTFKEPFDDVALLILAEEVDLEEDGVGLIALPTDRTLYEVGTTVTVAGWGGVSKHGSSANVLKVITQEVPDQTECGEYWRGVARVIAAEWGIPTTYVDNIDMDDWIGGMFCTGTPPLQQRIWYGDSGSPYFVTKNGTITQVSLVSWNTPEDTGIDWVTDHDMSVDVFFYLDWIKQNMV